MGHRGDRARTTPLGSGRLGLPQEVEAYRVLARASPAYLPKLVRALVSYGYEAGHRRGPERRLPLHAEAADAARRIGAGRPRRPGALRDAPEAYERTLFEPGRRAEGRAVCEEPAEAGRAAFERGQVERPAYGSARLAVVPAEEGRPAEPRAVHHRLAVRSASSARTAPVGSRRRSGPSSTRRWRSPGTAEGLPRALTDRATFLVAAKRYEEARADFAEVADPLDGAEWTPIVTAT
ncbi:hypothetical protein ACIGW0_12055 [Streptomyces bikiniensis]|uniref:Tetratricopeptide repeat protein n=1 Tax=Streptomyces bikiniensis TaxID=1896 RepID=A0ABW8CUB9_STRBI